MVDRDSKVDYFASSLFFLLIIIKSGLLAGITWSVCMLKSHRSLCVAFSRTGAGLCHLYIPQLFPFSGKVHVCVQLLAFLHFTLGKYTRWQVLFFLLIKTSFDWVIFLHLKIPENTTDLIFLNRFWFVNILFVSICLFLPHFCQPEFSYFAFLLFIFPCTIFRYQLIIFAYWTNQSWRQGFNPRSSHTKDSKNGPWCVLA